MPKPKLLQVAATETRTFSTGSTLLDCVLGGGWAEGRVANIVGDKSTGKTLLAIEAAANFHRKYPSSPIYHYESEAAFDARYAAELGFPEEAVHRPAHDIVTVEDFYEEVERTLADKELRSVPKLMILDSMDALSDRAEQSRGIDEGTFGANKAKKLGELFRRLIRLLEVNNCTLIIISQVRENIGVTFGDKYRRSGGKALDFYASQVVWLHHTGQIQKTVKGQKRAIGVKIRAKCKKNKVAAPFRECDFPLIFNYGVEDLTACVEWLHSVNMLPAGFEVADRDAKSYLRKALSLDDAVYFEYLDTVTRSTIEAWTSIETSFLPQRKKYT